MALAWLKPTTVITDSGNWSTNPVPNLDLAGCVAKDVVLPEGPNTDASIALISTSTSVSGNVTYSFDSSAPSGETILGFTVWVYSYISSGATLTVAYSLNGGSTWSADYTESFGASTGTHWWAVGNVVGGTKAQLDQIQVRLSITIPPGTSYLIDCVGVEVHGYDAPQLCWLNCDSTVSNSGWSANSGTVLSAVTETNRPPDNNTTDTTHISTDGNDDTIVYSLEDNTRAGSNVSGFAVWIRAVSPSATYSDDSTVVSYSFDGESWTTLGNVHCNLGGWHFWTQLTATGTWTKTDMDNLQLKLVNPAGGGTDIYVYQVGVQVLGTNEASANFFPFFV